MKIIQRRYTEEAVAYHHIFDCDDNTTCGFSFDCDENGKLLTEYEAAKENYRKCISGELAVIDRGIVKREHLIRHPAIGICNYCNEEVYLTSFTNTCECGTDYNSSGQELAPRSQWGCETGEHWTDCY